MVEDVFFNIFEKNINFSAVIAAILHTYSLEILSPVHWHPLNEAKDDINTAIIWNKSLQGEDFWRSLHEAPILTDEAERQTRKDLLKDFFETHPLPETWATDRILVLIEAWS